MDFEKELEKQMQEISLNESVGSDLRWMSFILKLINW